MERYTDNYAYLTAEVTPWKFGVSYPAVCTRLSSPGNHRPPLHFNKLSTRVAIRGIYTELPCDPSCSRGKWKGEDSVHNTPISSFILVFLYPALCYFHQLPTTYLSR
ncbi:hypothetical protein NQZ68_007758, partial [Dissostichus eleginoides]